MTHPIKIMLRLEWGGNVLGNRLNNIPADVIFCFGGQYVFGVAEN